jgi:chromosome segregation ATPase
MDFEETSSFESFPDSVEDAVESPESLENRKLKLELQDAENQISRLEYKTKTEIQNLKTEIDKLTKENTDLKENYRENSVNSSKKVEELSQIRHTMNSQVLVIQKLESEKRDLFSLNVKKQEEIENLKENLQDLQDLNNSTRQELLEASHELSNVSSSDAKMRSELSMCEQQIGQLKRNNEWLNQELQRTTQEFNDYRRSRVF